MSTKKRISILITIVVVFLIASTAFAGSVSFWFDSWLYGNLNGKYHTLNAGTARLNMTYMIDQTYGDWRYVTSKVFYVRLYRERVLIGDVYYGERSYTATNSYKTSNPQWTVDANSSKYYLVFWTPSPYNVAITGSGTLYNP
jgi:hypothetical protein